jgi:HAD superfamily hydrolase (TIGR01509 family)
VQADTVIFDMDGTLTDSMPFLAEGIRTVASELAGQQFTAEQASARFGPPDFDVIAELIGRPLTDGDRQAYLDHLRTHTRTQVPAIEGVPQMLQALRDQGIRLGVYTARALPAAEVVMAEMGLAGYFEAVLAGDLVDQPKPDPEGLLVTMQQMAADAARTIYVGDTLHDLQVADGAGVRSVLVLWAQQPRTHLIERADHHFHDPASFTDWVLSGPTP